MAKIEGGATETLPHWAWWNSCQCCSTSLKRLRPNGEGDARSFLEQTTEGWTKSKPGETQHWFWYRFQTSQTVIIIAIQRAWWMDELPLSTKGLLQQGRVMYGQWYRLWHYWFLDTFRDFWTNPICLLGLETWSPKVTGFWNRTR